MYASYPTSQLREAELRTFLRPPHNKAAVVGRVLGVAALGFTLAAGGFYLLNLNAFQRVAQVQAITTTPSPSTTPLATPLTNTSVAVAAVATPTPTPIVPNIPNNTLSFASLNISAPITWGVSAADTKTIESTLPNSLIQITGTAKPGQHGMVVVFGHSSNYPWIKGSYNSIFAPLEKASFGQTVELSNNNVVYTYQVTQVYVVAPTKLSIMDASTFDGLRLITCTPIGTSTNRLVVEAKQISPDPATNSSFNQATFTTGSIPSGQ